MLLLASVLWSCRDANTSPPGTPGIRILAGANSSDSVLTRLLQPLTVEVRDLSGRLATNRAIVFSSLPAVDPNRASETTLRFEPFTSPLYSNSLTEFTDSRGQASVLVQLGTVAGPMRAVATVPDLGLADTVVFTVQPGALVGGIVSPQDTTVIAGAVFQLSFKTFDRFKNVVPTPTLQYYLGPGIASISPSGVVTTVGTVSTVTSGVTFVLLNQYVLVDTLRVTVIPP